MPYDVAKLLTLSQAELDKLFTDSPVGNIPDGRSRRHRHRRTGDNL